jgi:transcriptional regulator with XRE-family HTH domain
MNYGKAVRIARAIAGLTQSELAADCRVNASHISLIEKGKRKPSSRTVEKIARALRIPMYLLVFLGAEPEDYKESLPNEISDATKLLTKFIIHNNPEHHQRRNTRRAKS